MPVEELFIHRSLIEIGQGEVGQGLYFWASWRKKRKRNEEQS
jgi:hypothetical protein